MKKEAHEKQLSAQGEEVQAEAATEEKKAPVIQQTAPAQQGRDPELLRRHFYAHFLGLERQAAALQDRYPGLDLKQELRNPMFSRLTSPAVGLSVEDAYCAVHRSELQAKAMAAAQQQVTNAIASGARRPVENGLAGQQAVISAFDYRKATPKQREDLKKSIRYAAAEGKKLYPQG